MSSKSLKRVSSSKSHNKINSLPSKVSEEVASGVSELYLKYNCNYCQEDIPGLRIKCAECSDFDLCLDCFACGATNGKHKNSHKYLFMNNGGFSIFPNYSSSSSSSSSYSSLSSANDDIIDDFQDDVRTSKRYSSSSFSSFNHNNHNGNGWNAREEVRLLDAVEQYGYGNWKDIAHYIETKTPDQAKEQYIKHYIHGVVGKHTWKEELRGVAVDHTQASADRGPLSPTLTSKLPPINVSTQEAMLLGYMPHRDDFEDFDKETENLVSQIADKSVEDEDVDIALKLAQCDIYERRLREQVRRKRVARDYQLVSKFYLQNPIVQIGTKVSPLKISNQVKAVKKGSCEGPRAELLESFKSLTQFVTSQELYQLINNICSEKELKVRVKELFKYRENGISKIDELIPFEKLRFKREFRHRRLLNKNKPIIGSGPRLLPVPGDYSLKAILDPHHYETVKPTAKRPIGTPISGVKKKRAKKSMWSRKKEKTGRRLLIQQGCILTMADSARDSTDSN